MTMLPITRRDGTQPIDSGSALPQSPFVWGQGGAQLSPDDIARQMQVAQALSAPDFSPVEGGGLGALGRAAQNIYGAFQQKRLDKKSEAANASQAAIIQSLVGSNTDLVPGLTSKDPVVAALAGDVFKSRQPKQATPDTFDRALAGAGIDPSSPQGMALYAQRANTLAAPSPQFVSDGLGGGRWVTPPSNFMQGGGGPASPMGAPTAPVGKLTPIQMGGPSQSAAGGF